MKDFFISYNKADVDWAEWIGYQLEEAGYNCILQAWDFGVGSNFIQKMQEGTEANKTVMVLSPDYLSSLYTQPEWQAAFAIDPTGNNRKLLPIKVKACQPPGLLSQIVWCDLIGKSEEDARNLLLAAASGNRNKPNKPPIFPGSIQHTVTDKPGFPGADTNKLSDFAVDSEKVQKADFSSAKERLEKAFKTRPPQNMGSVWLQFAITPYKDDEYLDPNNFAQREFRRKVIKTARNGDPALFDDISEIKEESKLTYYTVQQTQQINRQEATVKLTLYTDGTISIAFSGLHRTGEDVTSFTHYYIDQDIVKDHIDVAFNFIGEWLDVMYSATNIDQFYYNLAFYDVQYQTFGKTPSGKISQYSMIQRRSWTNPQTLYPEPRRLVKDDLKEYTTITQHIITRALLLFDQKD